LLRERPLVLDDGAQLAGRPFRPGGHTVRRRFLAGKSTFVSICRAVDGWVLYDDSASAPVVVD
jgi:hypothetical protein